MIPFTIYLNKQDVDELISMLVKSNDLTDDNNIVLTEKELINLTENLMKQNLSLLELLKKIDLSRSSSF